MVAAGSGLAPLYGMLKELDSRKLYRPITLLFGAKTQKDLYYLDELNHMRSAWPEFRFVPVLSQVEEDDQWQGTRGRVTDHLKHYCNKVKSAYLCGSSSMVNAVENQLLELGLNHDEIYSDRFIAQNPPVETGFSAGAELPVTMRPKATVWDYLKFMSFHFLGLVSALIILLGGIKSIIGLLLIVGIFSIGDYCSGEDKRAPSYQHKRVLNWSLWMALPVLMFVVFSALWSFLPGDLLGFGAWLSDISGYDLLLAKTSNGMGATVSNFILTGLMIGLLGTIAAHELTHRTWDRTSMWVGRWLLAFSFDTAFAIEHVYGHHRYVSTTQDPATAPRGRNVYYHVLISTIKGNLSAWRIETERLERKHQSLGSLQNAFLTGQLMSLVLVTIAGYWGGMAGVIYFIGIALFGKAMLEVVNYMEHYGMIRLPDSPVQPRHSWNTNARLTSWAMFNLSRHSHHHAQGEVPFEDLLPLRNAPTMIAGYLATMLLTLIPPLWHRLMTPKLLEWDKHYASSEEQELIREANQKSGIKQLMNAANQVIE